jgi:hypothetical protein
VAELQFEHSVIDPSPPGRRNDICLPGDIDGDGLQDLVIGGYDGRDNIVWYQAPDWERHTLGQAVCEAGGVLVDLTGNGRLDLVVGNPYTGNELYWFEQPDDPAQRWTRRVIETEFTKYHDQAVGDVDGDGRAELVFASQAGQVVGYFRIPEDPRVEPWPRECRHILLEGEVVEGLAVADLFGDGRRQIIAGGNVFQLADGEWQRTHFSDFALPVVAAADLTGDGRQEIILVEGEADSGRLAWFSGPGWAMHPLDDALFHPHSLGVADFDGDGLMDIFVGEMGLGKHDRPRVIVYRSLGGGKFEPLVIDDRHPTHHAKVIHLAGSRLPSIVGKSFHPTNQVDLWTNVTEE